MGLYAAYNVAVGKLSVLRDLVSIYEESTLCPIDLSDPLEEEPYLLSHGVYPFWIIWPLH